MPVLMYHWYCWDGTYFQCQTLLISGTTWTHFISDKFLSLSDKTTCWCQTQCMGNRWNVLSAEVICHGDISWHTGMPHSTTVLTLLLFKYHLACGCKIPNVCCNSKHMQGTDSLCDDNRQTRKTSSIEVRPSLNQVYNKNFSDIENFHFQMQYLYCVGVCGRVSKFCPQF